MKLKEKDKARELRYQGFSIKQIADDLKVSKGSVSVWVRDVKLSESAAVKIGQRLQSGREHARESLLRNNLEQRDALYQRCKTDILPLSNRDLWIAGLMLYAGEGRKVWDVSSQPIELTSSDPFIHRIFINFLTKICKVPCSKIKIRLFLYPDINLKEAKGFWSRELNIPLKQFQRSFIKQSYSNPIRIRRTKYGTAHIVLNNAELYRKILGWLKAVYGYYE